MTRRTVAGTSNAAIARSPAGGASFAPLSTECFPGGDQAQIDECQVVYELATKTKRSGTMVDVGAYHGHSLARFLAAGWDVYAFEPDPASHAELIRKYDGRPNLRISAEAVSEFAGQNIPFYVSEESAGFSGLSAFHSSHREVTRVNTVSLDDVVGRHGLKAIDFLKIDVEGFGLAVLRGLDFSKLAPSAILVGYEDTKIHHNYGVHDLARFLIDRGYTIYVSEWHPIERYGVERIFRGFCSYSHEAAFTSRGHLLAFKVNPEQRALKAAIRASVNLPVRFTGESQGLDFSKKSNMADRLDGPGDQANGNGAVCAPAPIETYPLARAIKGQMDECDLVYRFVEGRNRPGVMVDVGAHFGESLNSFAASGWTAYAFEPDPANRAELLSNYGKLRNVIISDQAVSDHAGLEMPFYSSSESTGISGLSAFRETHREVARVTTTTLNDIVARHGIRQIDFLKIDVEGFEMAVLRGLDFSKIMPGVVLAEYENDKTEAQGYNVYDLCRFLTGVGYAVYVSEWHPIKRYGVKHSFRRILRYPCEVHPKSWGNLIAFRRDPEPEKLKAAIRRAVDKSVTFVDDAVKPAQPPSTIPVDQTAPAAHAAPCKPPEPHKDSSWLVAGGVLGAAMLVGGIAVAALLVPGNRIPPGWPYVWLLAGAASTLTSAILVGVLLWRRYRGIEFASMLAILLTAKGRKLSGPMRKIAASGLFNGQWYLAHNPDVAEAVADPLLHYVKHGAGEGRQPCPYFDPHWYLVQNPDVAQSGVEPFTHYLTYGWRENRDPSPLFNTAWYLQENPDVAASGVEPLAHYARMGWREGRNPCALFKAAWYLAQYPDVHRAGVEPLAHYLSAGWREGRSPNPLFKPLWYIGQHPDVARANVEPLGHFMSSGWKEDCSPHPDYPRAITALGLDTNGKLSWKEIEAVFDITFRSSDLLQSVAWLRREGYDALATKAAQAEKRPVELASNAGSERLEQGANALRQELPAKVAGAEGRAAAAAKVTSMVDAPKFSIVIPTRNRASTLKWALRTCLDSDYPNFEVVVSDNDSSDDTAAVVAAYADPRIRYIKTPAYLSMSRNFEYALNHADGEFVIFIGDDDGILPFGLRVLQQCFERQPDLDAIDWALNHFLWPNGRHAQLPLNWLSNLRGPVIETAEEAWRRINRPRSADYNELNGFNLYHGCFRRRVIEAAEKAGVCLVAKPIPDVAASIRVLRFARKKLQLDVAITINGTSKRSNGLAHFVVTPAELQLQVRSDFHTKTAEDFPDAALVKYSWNRPNSFLGPLIDEHFARYGHLRELDLEPWRPIYIEYLVRLTPALLAAILPEVNAIFAWIGQEGGTNTNPLSEDDINLCRPADKRLSNLYNMPFRFSDSTLKAAATSGMTTRRIADPRIISLTQRASDILLTAESAEEEFTIHDYVQVTTALMRCDPFEPGALLASDPALFRSRVVLNVLDHLAAGVSITDAQRRA